jgi:hypothetical protein
VVVGGSTTASSAVRLGAARRVNGLPIPLAHNPDDFYEAEPAPVALVLSGTRTAGRSARRGCRSSAVECSV